MAGSLRLIIPLMTGLNLAAEETARAAVRVGRRQLGAGRRRRRGNVLRPGPETPLWLEVAAAAQRAFRRRGDKAKLARILGISRQRLHVLLVARTACPDAERTLRLLLWLQARQQGEDLA